MPLFIYTATDNTGRTRIGEVQASDKADAVSKLERDRLTPLSIELKGVNAFSINASVSFSRINAVDRILLTRHLASVVKAGLSLREALEILWEDTKKPALKQVLFDAKSNLERGQPLSLVFEMYPQYFPPVFVGLVKAGEKSGTLEETLQNLGEQLIRDYDLVKRIRSALIYPAILFMASIGVVILLLTFLLPRLVKVFQTTNAELPLITKFFIAVSGILSAYPFLTVSAFLAVLIAGFLILRSAQGRSVVLSHMQHLPLMGDIIQKLALARFTRTFRNLLKSGISALEALDITARTIGNRRYGDALLEIQDEIRRGGSLSAGFRSKERLFPRLLISMILVGERTGTLEKSLETLAAFYDEEVDRTLKNLVGLLEPVLLIIMGLVVGGVALSVLLPIYQLVGNFR